MSVDWSATNVSTVYATLVAQIVARDIDVATFFDGSTSTNIPALAKRWSTTNNRFESWSGSAWSALTLGVSGGGTGSTSAAGARSNLGLGDLSTQSVAPVAMGGTGASDVATARSNLGLGAVATDNVVPVARGGTGASTASAARSGLGFSVVLDNMLVASTLAAARSALGATTVGEGVFTASNVAAALTALGASAAEVRNFFTAADVANARSALGLGALAQLSSVGTAQIADGSVTPAKCSPSLVCYDIPFCAGFNYDFTGQNLNVQTYAEMVLGRNITFQGEVGYISTAPTGSAVIMDITINGNSISITSSSGAASPSRT